jgi:hypothetical protein
MTHALVDRRCAEDSARPQHEQDEQHAIGGQIANLRPEQSLTVDLDNAENEATDNRTGD